MRKDKTTKPDGRYIIYYSFDEDELSCEDSDSEIATQAQIPSPSSPPSKEKS